MIENNASKVMQKKKKFTKHSKISIERIIDNRALNKFLRAVVAYCPQGTRDRLQRAKWKIKLAFGKRLVSVEPLRKTQREALQWLIREVGMEKVGDYLEFGVFNGTSLHCMYQELEAAALRHVRLFGFDSWQGLPADSGGEQDGYQWTPGYFQMDYAYCRKWLGQQGVDWNRIFLTKGWFNETCTPALIAKHRITKASIIMVDCDVYSSTRDALEFCAPLIKDKAVLLLDDWGVTSDHPVGMKRAFLEFLQAHPEFTAEDIGQYDAWSRVFRIHRQGCGDLPGA
jgi:hypothetical protein